MGNKLRALKLSDEPSDMLSSEKMGKVFWGTFWGKFMEGLMSDYFKDKEDEINKLNEYVERFQKDFIMLQDENSQLKNRIFNQICKTNDMINTQDIQSIPVSIYLDTNRKTEITKAYSAVLDFLASINFAQAIDLKPVKGSWFKKLIADSKSVMTSQEVIDRLKEAEYGVEVNNILKPQSEVDKNHSEALSNILKSIENIPNAAIRIGSLLVVKITNKKEEVNIQVRTLTIKELHLLNKKPELLTKPSAVLLALAKEISNESINPILQN